MISGLALRGVLTALLFTAVWAFNAASSALAPLIAGPASVLQLENSDQSYGIAKLGMTLDGSGVSILLVMLALALIWWRPVAKLFAIVGLLALLGSPAFAYYDKVNYPEFVEIAPNETAFLIPVVGANKDSQGTFMSREYLSANKVAMKRVEIPHTLIRNPGWAADYYVPATKLIIVDRTPYTREWVGSGNRGTSAKDESFRFESADSVDMSTGIAISAFVREEDTATFLYYFGAPTPGSSTDPAVNFASVARGRSLAQVMDTNVRSNVQIVMAREFGRRTSTDGAKQKAEIMAVVAKEVTAAFAEKGVTIDYIGFAEGITYGNTSIQHAIDEVVIAERKAAAARIVQEVMPTMQALADVKVREAIPAIVGKWDGKLPGLPSFVVLPENLLGVLPALIRPPAAH